MAPSYPMTMRSWRPERSGIGSVGGGFNPEVVNDGNGSAQEFAVATRGRLSRRQEMPW